MPHTLTPTLLNETPITLSIPPSSLLTYSDCFRFHQITKSLLSSFSSYHPSLIKHCTSLKMHSAIRSMRSATRSAVAQSVRLFFTLQTREEMLKWGNGKWGTWCYFNRPRSCHSTSKYHGSRVDRDRRDTPRLCTLLTIRPEHDSHPSLPGPTLPLSLVSYFFNTSINSYLPSSRFRGLFHPRGPNRRYLYRW